MYFLWKDTPHGLIKISHEGLYEFADNILNSKLQLYSIALAAEKEQEDADFTIVISDENLTPEVKTQIEDHLLEVIAPLGAKTSVVWASPERGIIPLLSNSYAAAVLASCCVVISMAGLEIFFWTTFWGVAAWFAVRGLAILAKKFRSA